MKVISKIILLFVLFVGQNVFAGECKLPPANAKGSKISKNGDPNSIMSIVTPCDYKLKIKLLSVTPIEGACIANTRAPVFVDDSIPKRECCYYAAEREEDPNSPNADDYDTGAR